MCSRWETYLWLQLRLCSVTTVLVRQNIGRNTLGRQEGLGEEADYKDKRVPTPPHVSQGVWQLHPAGIGERVVAAWLSLFPVALAEDCGWIIDTGKEFVWITVPGLVSSRLRASYYFCSWWKVGTCRREKAATQTPGGVNLFL